MTRTLSEELNELHAAYAAAVNVAVEADDVAAAETLAKAYDEEAWQLVAEWEGKTHLLRELRPATYDTPLRRLVRRLRLPHAA